jgi:histidine ammonia-lyase
MLKDGRLGDGTGEIVEKLRQIVPFIKGDTLWGEEIAKVNRMLKGHTL